MKTKILVLKMLVVAILCAGSISYAQEQESNPKKLYKKAQKYFEYDEMELCVDAYIELIRIDSNNFDYNYDLALIYYYNFKDKEKALPLLEKAIGHSNEEGLGGLYYYLGKCYQFTGQPAKALAAYEEFLKVVKDNKFGIELIIEVNDAILTCINSRKPSELDNGYVRVVNLGSDINSVHPDYSPVLNANENILMYTTRRNVNSEDGVYYEDIYMSNRKNGVYQKANNVKRSKHDVVLLKEAKFHTAIIEKLTKGEKFHNAIVGLNHNENTFLIYKRNKLWISNYFEGYWREPIKIEGVQDFGRYQPHGSITADGKSLFLSMTNSKKHYNMDIYKCSLQEDGTWSLPENLGDVVNSKLNEDSPEISADGTVLTFSSKGHKSFGGYDVYMSYLVNDVWSEPVNLGEPVNSLGDDIFFKLNEKGDRAFFSSNRGGGYGDMDIYYAFYNVSLFEEAEEYRNKEHKISLDASNLIKKGELVSAEENEKEMIYEWEIGDGTVFRGKSLDHTFKKPGKYKLKLNVIDPDTKKIVRVEDDILIKIDNVTYIDFEMPDTVKLGAKVLFDAKEAVVANSKIIEYTWDFSDNTMDDSAYAYHQFDNPGVYIVQLVVSSLDNLTYNRSDHLVKKNIVVLSDENYYDFVPALAEAKEKERVLQKENEIVAEKKSALSDDVVESEAVALYEKQFEEDNDEDNMRVISLNTIGESGEVALSEDSKLIIKYTEVEVQPEAIDAEEIKETLAVLKEKRASSVYNRLLPVMPEEEIASVKADIASSEEVKDDESTVVEGSGNDELAISFDLIMKYNDLYDNYLKQYIEDTLLAAKGKSMTLFDFSELAYELKLNVVTEKQLDSVNMAQLYYSSKYDSRDAFANIERKSVKELDLLFDVDTGVVIADKEELALVEEVKTEVVADKSELALVEKIETEIVPVKEEFVPEKDEVAQVIESSVPDEEKVNDVKKQVEVVSEQKSTIVDSKLIEKKEENVEEIAIDIGSNLDTTKVDEENMPSYLPSFKMETAYFGFDKSFITKEAGDVLMKNIEKLKQNPTYYVKLSAYTDALGNKEYNMKLSEERAKSVVDYLVARGVSKDRIIAVLALGEDNPVNKCGDDSQCTIEQHRLNRRVEMQVQNPVNK